MDRWCGKVAVVTGAATGIGAAVARRLCDAGLQVIGLDPQLEKMQQICGIHPIQCDISKEDQLEAAFCHVEQKFGGLQVLVSNAGVIDFKPIIDSDKASLDRVMNINLTSAASAIAKSVKSMRKSKCEGHILHVNSILGHVIPSTPFSPKAGSNSFSLYPASKHAGVAMTKSLRKEITQAKLPIRVTSICPGLVKTELSKDDAAVKSVFETGPAILPDDIADSIIYAMGTRPEVQVAEVTVYRIWEHL